MLITTMRLTHHTGCHHEAPVSLSCFELALGGNGYNTHCLLGSYGCYGQKPTDDQQNPLCLAVAYKYRAFMSIPCKEESSPISHRSVPKFHRIPFRSEQWELY